MDWGAGLGGDKNELKATNGLPADVQSAGHSADSKWLARGGVEGEVPAAGAARRPSDSDAGRAAEMKAEIADYSLVFPVKKGTIAGSAKTELLV